MSPTDKNEASTNSDANDEGQRQKSVISKGMDQFPAEIASSSTADLSENGTITSIPLFTAKISTLKCSINDQMKTFDPGEGNSNEKTSSKHCGYPLPFSLKNSNSVTKCTKNYKAGSKINKLADMLARRSQNVVEMTQNVTSDVFSDIISAPKVENNCNSLEVSDNSISEEKLEFSTVFCEKTGVNIEVDSVNQSQKKSVPNDNIECNIQDPQLNTICCSDISELVLPDESALSELNALKKHLIKPETDGSTKPKKEIRKNLKNVELSLILPEKKRRFSPRKKLMNSNVIKDVNDFNYQEQRSRAKTLKPDEKSSNNDQKKTSVICGSGNTTGRVKFGRQRKSKKLVETSTQTVTTDFNGAEAKTQPTSETVSEGCKDLTLEVATSETVTSPVSTENRESDSILETDTKVESKTKFEDLAKDSEKCIYACMYCTATFVCREECKDHEMSHSPRKIKQITKCQFCIKQYPSVYDLKLHCIKNHPNKYAYCIKCDARFCEKSQLYSHNKLFHLTKAMQEAQNYVKIQETLGFNSREKRKEDEKNEEPKKSDQKKSMKPSGGKTDLKVDVSFDSGKKSSTSPRNIQKMSPRDNKTEEQLLEMEMLFYSHLSGNIKENLTNHLDGKIDKSGNQIQTDVANETSENSQTKPKASNLLCVVSTSSSGTPTDQISRAPSPYQTRSKTPNPFPPTAKKFKKLPNWQQKFWEKYNFPTNYRYEHRFWDKNYLNTEKSALYLKDLSCLDIKTQITMRENIKKLDNMKSNDETNKLSDKMTFPEYLSLVPRALIGNVQETGKVMEEFLNSGSQDEREKLTKPARVEVARLRKKTETDNCILKRQPEISIKTDGVKILTRRQSIKEMDKDLKKSDDVGKRRKGSLDVTGSQKMTLRRQTSADNLQKICGIENSIKTDKILNNETFDSVKIVDQKYSEGAPYPSCSGLAEISGEWVRPRSYLCGTCCAKFNNLWELEDHKWVSHPNVWCTHYEFEDEKIDKLFHRSDVEAGEDVGTSENPSPLSKLKLTDLYKRYLLPHGSLKTAKLVPNVSFPEKCTKCKKNCMNSSEMHKHMLDCGGDTTWFLTMYSSPMTIKRKWRPFGSRRRKQIGRRMVKRNIPNTPNIRPYHYQHRIRTKPGDVESIQKMLANLPEKRARRAINFDEIKTRSQATIHSNRLLRKRFKVSFGANIMRLKALKQQRPVKPLKKEGSSKSATDTSSENTPNGSPKRRSKPKEDIQLSNEENLFIETIPGSSSEENKILKKKVVNKNKKKENVTKQDLTKKNIKKENNVINTSIGKPLTRSNSIGNVEIFRETEKENNKKKKGQITKKLESGPTLINQDMSSISGKRQNRMKNGKQTMAQKNKKPSKIVAEREVKEESIPVEIYDSVSSLAVDEEGFMKKKMKSEIKEENILVGFENEEILNEKMDHRKTKTINLPNKNILRLKTNDKEKTELIKRIQKTLKNSKRILEKRENKEEYERRRSLRIKTLQSTDLSLKPFEDLPSTSEKTQTELIKISETKEKNSISSVKKSSKSVKSPRAVDSISLPDQNPTIDVTLNRRSLRIMSATSINDKYGHSVKKSQSDQTIEKFASGNSRKMSKVLSDNSASINQSEHFDAFRSPCNVDMRSSKEVEQDSDSMSSNALSSKESVESSRLNKAQSTIRVVRRLSHSQDSAKLEFPCESKSNDLSEMPVLDKEEPLYGRTSHKNETEIPILMPFENEVQNLGKSEGKSAKRKCMDPFNVLKKRRSSPEKLNLVTAENHNVLLNKNIFLGDDSRTLKNNKTGESLLKSRKRNLTQELLNSDKSPKTPKTKKYFLEICPNEIDKGGHSKDESGSDSEPLISLVLGQKEKESSEEDPRALKLSGSPSCETFSESMITLDKTENDNLTCSLAQESKSKFKKEARKVVDQPEVKKKCEKLVFLKDPEETINELAEVEQFKAKDSMKKPLVFPQIPGQKYQGIQNKTMDDEISEVKPSMKSSSGLKVTVELKEATLKIAENSSSSSIENKWNSEMEICSVKMAGLVNENPIKDQSLVESPHVNETKKERRSSRISKEVKSTNEFIIDDPLILVDELWSDLDSDSEGSRKRSKKGKKKATKKKVNEDQKESSIDLEELLRNFGEGKNLKTEADSNKSLLKLRKQSNLLKSHTSKRSQLENRNRYEGKSYRRLSLRLFRFQRKVENFGGLGQRLSSLTAKVRRTNEIKTDYPSRIPTLPFLAAEIKENPVQIIQCGAQKMKLAKKGLQKSEAKSNTSIQLKISLPLQNINDLSVLNNNHLTEISPDLFKSCKGQESSISSTEESGTETQALEKTLLVKEETSEEIGRDEEAVESPDMKFKSRRSEVIDKIFYCEICKTYYYSSSQLKIHKLSNRHKLKESSLLLDKNTEVELGNCMEELGKEQPQVQCFDLEEEGSYKPPNFVQIENVDLEKINDDTSEMPILEGPFIENPFVRLGMDIMEPPPKPAPPPSVFGFTEDCLKDIQKAIGCTDEEMLILTLLGENSIELENEILDLDSCKSVASNSMSFKNEVPAKKERENSNGLHKVDFKKRITSALARLVNKAVLNLLHKYKNTSKTGISSEALSFLVKLSKVNNKKDFLKLDELLKNDSGGESSNQIFTGESDRKIQNASYKYLCTICGSRFQKESTKECHIIRSHKCKSAVSVEEASSEPEQRKVKEDDKDEPNFLYKYFCIICGSRFPTESARECHILRFHPRKGKKNIEEPSSSPIFTKQDEKRELNIPYKYLCTICGSRFQKESMWECHIKRSHRSKGKKSGDELQITQTTYEDDWSSTWTYDINDDFPGSVETPQFLCSDCGINFLSPQEVLEHQKSEHAGQKDIEVNESGPLQSSTIGSSDEILRGKRVPRRGPKHLSKAELDQQRIIANNELRKLDRKLTNKAKNNKIRWGVDAMRFTVEKENKVLDEEDEKKGFDKSLKTQVDVKNIDIVPKLNLFRTNNIPEFKVVQKASCLNRFQRILDNKMKRKSTRGDTKEVEKKGVVDDAFMEPISVVKKERKRKPNRCSLKKDHERKVVDIYDFNDSESDPEPVAFSHIKKGALTQLPTRLKLVKVKEVNETSKNKADSTTKDPETEDYDSEDSLPLSVVKKTKTEEDDEDVRFEDQIEKPEGILEQVEYLIEQLENETNLPKSKKSEKEKKIENLRGDTKSPIQKKTKTMPKPDFEYIAEEKSKNSQQESFLVSLEHKFLRMESLSTKKKCQEVNTTSHEAQDLPESMDKIEKSTAEKFETILPVIDSSRGVSDEEDSLPLVLMSKKNDLATDHSEFFQGSTQKFHKGASLLSRENSSSEPYKDDKASMGLDRINSESSKITIESMLLIPCTENKEPSEKSEKLYDALNGNVIYRKNDSMSGFDSDYSESGGFDFTVEKTDRSHAESESLIKEVMEKEDVVIVCSKKEQYPTKGGKRKSNEFLKRKKSNEESSQGKKRILPLLSVTLEEDSFGNSFESPKVKKEEIMKKIWSKRKFSDNFVDEISEDSITSMDNEMENNYNDDSHIEIDKEIIVKKIWNKKRFENDGENGEVSAPKSDDRPDLKINQTEVSDEVVIKCGPRAKSTTKRRKSKSSIKESSKEKIMRKIWSGKCAFQTKAALKTYDSDILQGNKEKNTFQNESRVKKRGRPPNYLNARNTKIQSDEEKSDDEDDLDSLLEEIEREEVEKAIRLEFLQLRRSDKANAEVSKENGGMTVGLFAETCRQQGSDLTIRRRKKIKKNINHPRKNLLTRRKFIRKTAMKPSQPQQQLQEPEEDSEIPSRAETCEKADVEPSVTNKKLFDLESKIKNRKHKKHRHKHHHHKHKHKKSKHRKDLFGKHKMKHKSTESSKEKPEMLENFSLLEKICQDIPISLEKQSQKRFGTELTTLDTKLDEILMSTSSSFEGKTRDCDDVFYNVSSLEKQRNHCFQGENVYEFVEDDSSFLWEMKGSHKN